MSRGLGATQRYVLEVLCEARTAVPLRQIADLRAGGYVVEDFGEALGSDPDERRDAQDRAWLESPSATASEIESMRRAVHRLQEQGLVHIERALNCLWVTLP